MNALERLFTRLGAEFAAWLLSLRPRVIKLLAGPVPPEARGLHPEALLLGRLSSLPRPGLAETVGHVAKLREQVDIEAAVFGRLAPRDVKTADRTVPGPAGPIPVRTYEPPGAPAAGPLLVFFHGGGWIEGSLDSHDSVCRTLAHVAGVRVVAVDYRMAPEHVFPAAYEDAVAAHTYISDHTAEFGADPARIAVGGDSAGGNLAAVVSNAALRGECPAPAFQLLIYPVTDTRMDQQSHRLYDRGYYLTREKMDLFVSSYLIDHTEREDPRAAPIYETDLTGAAPAYVATALADPLRDEGVQYAEKLRAAGVPAEHEEFPLIHGFVNMSASRAARRATARIAEALRRGLEG